MRSKHYFDRGISSREQFLEAYEVHNTSLVSRFGGFPVDAIWLSEETRGIIVYGENPGEDGHEIIACDEPFNSSKKQSMARVFPLHPPGEWITEVVVHKQQGLLLKMNPLAVTVSPHLPCLTCPDISITNWCLVSLKRTGIVNFKLVSFKATGIYHKRFAHLLAIPSRGSIFRPEETHLGLSMRPNLGLSVPLCYRK